jgi:hypothetical protein
VATKHPDPGQRSKLHAVLSRVCPTRAGGPTNVAAFRRDAGLALGNAASLLGYHQYLAEARTWKARGAVVPAGFDRELQAQASGALGDTHALASAALRMTNQYKQAGHLDRMLSGWTAALEQTGPVLVADLLADVQHDEGIRQKLRDQGVRDDIWNSLLSNLTHIEGSVSARDGKLVAELKGGGPEAARTIVLAPEATGMPRTLAELLRRGTFERHAQLFTQNGGATLHLLPGPARDLALPQVILGVSLLSMRSMAAHTRGLQDAGLAKYAGNAAVVVWVVAVLAALVIGYLLVDEYCPKDDSTPSAACIAGTILFILGTLGGMLLLMVGLAILFPAGPGGPPSCSGTTVYVYDPKEGRFVFDHCDPFPP